MAVGILAVQGAFVEHAAMLERLGAEHFEIRQPQDLEQPLNGLILPGGESTAMGKLLRDLGLFQLLRERIQAGLPVKRLGQGLLGDKEKRAVLAAPPSEQLRFILFYFAF